MADKRTHLEMIQGVINRLAQNSFSLKGWSVVIVSAIFALAANDGESLFAYLACFPVIVFWGLDGYFLRQERLFRKLYDDVRGLSDGDIDFSMDTSKVEDSVDSWIVVTLSPTLRAFHGVVLFSVFVVSLIVLYS